MLTYLCGCCSASLEPNDGGHTKKSHLEVVHDTSLGCHVSHDRRFLCPGDLRISLSMFVDFYKRVLKHACLTFFGQVLEHTVISGVKVLRKFITWGLLLRNMHNKWLFPAEKIVGRSRV